MPKKATLGSENSSFDAFVLDLRLKVVIFDAVLPIIYPSESMDTCARSYKFYSIEFAALTPASPLP